MKNKLALVLSISAAMYLQAQQGNSYWDFTEIRNSSDVYGNNLEFNSARSVGMAGALGALGGDIASTTINPAGVGVAIAGDFQGTIGFQSNKNTSNLAGSSSMLKDNNTRLSQIGGIIAFPVNSNKWKFVNLGVNYINKDLSNQVLTPGNHNIYSDVDWTDQNGNIVHDKLMYNGHRYDRSGHASKMGISVGGNYENRIYVGAGLNFHSANFDQYDYYQGIYDSDGKTEIYDKQFTPYSENSTGFSASLGIIGRVSNQFRLGASIETPTWWNIDRVYTQYTPNANDNNIQSIDNYRESRNFRSPMKATLSAAFVPSKSFAFNVDYTVGLSKPHFEENTSINRDLNQFFDQNSKSQSEVRLGAEYRLEGFRLRAGYAFASNPFDSQTIAAFQNNGNMGNSTFSNLYVGKRNIAGVGIGYDFKSFYIDAAYQNVNYKYDNAFASGDYATYDSSNHGVIVSNDAAIVSEVKNQQNNIFITLGYRF
ncbi:OmpP1/FadL family transporter [Elizabethkingia sp. JS20170427COW]|uniref:OmpP1/FadL family transporter n=1 Tax=Elizabethkingia sp. JS20170427COW TaxID=2583851 RepID=UPI0011107D44|nr:hemin receptor [Elizabethkingia sp. JS20170427COW]QCX53841.1 hemin receptor [Elizabethkingia sp. JS20170427COW]